MSHAIAKPGCASLLTGSVVMRLIRHSLPEASTVYKRATHSPVLAISEIIFNSYAERLWSQPHLQGFVCSVDSERALYAVDANCDVMRPNPSVVGVVPLEILASTKIQSTEVEQECFRNKSKNLKQKSSRSNASGGDHLVLPALLALLVISDRILALVHHPRSQDTGLSPHLVPGPSLETNELSRRGVSAMSLPGEISRKLLNMSMQRTQISGFELHIGRVVKSFQPGSCEFTVPALYYAMLLLGCYFSPESELKFWENMIYERTKLEIETNTARALMGNSSKYNPLYHLQAMVMLGQWFYLKGRLLEGHVYIARATRFVVALGIHALDSRIYGRYVVMSQGTTRRSVERWRPRDAIELGEAINLCWACFARDFAGTLLNGLPPSILLEEIQTVWPVSLSDFEDMSGSELLNDSHSVASLMDPKYLDVVADISQDTASCLLAKGIMLIHCAGMLDTERISSSEVTDEWLIRFEACDRATKIFTESARKAYTGRNIEGIATIALAQTAVDCATIQLHAPLADYELDIDNQGGTPGRSSGNSFGGYSHTRCMEACRSIALTAKYVERVDTSYMHMFMGVSWSCAASLLAKRMPRLRQNGYTEEVREMEQQIAIMAKSMERLLLTYPLLALQAERLRAVLRQ
ncbi:unnamed protein product [Rhizoctonia solani]|uniref:Xylanolytic transcriptional activator regulatory domain-containing protein n=1 Tax=Rhizoctonia solani TaxID=456999 RepID=A0A8H3ASP6_9AGAM|nr:unnamed protein product [Rhizoctonia solani]